MEHITTPKVGRSKGTGLDHEKNWHAYLKNLGFETTHLENMSAMYKLQHKAHRLQIITVPGGCYIPAGSPKGLQFVETYLSTTA